MAKEIKMQKRILGKDLEMEIINKVEKNKNRVYKNIDGRNIRIKD